MNDSSEKTMFRLLDGLEEEKLSELGDVEAPGEGKPDAETLLRIKRQTWAKLGIAPAPAPAQPADERPNLLARQPLHEPHAAPAPAQPADERPNLLARQPLHEPHAAPASAQPADEQPNLLARQPMHEPHAAPAPAHPADERPDLLARQPMHEPSTAHPSAPRPVRPFRRLWQVAIAAAALLILAVGLSFTTDVKAELRKMLQFIPGLGIVQEGDADKPAYVLETPVKVASGKGEITVEAVMLEPNQTIITLLGTNTPQIREFQLKTGDGREYPFTFSTLVNSNIWQGTYYYPNPIELSAAEEITLQLPDMVIGPLKLKPAKESDALQELGHSAERAGIQIVAVDTPIDEETTKITLLSRLPEGRQIESFGKETITGNVRLELRDGQGAEVPILEDTGFLRPKELLFKHPLQRIGELTLTMPYIRVVDRQAAELEVKLPVPAEGFAPLNETVTLAGFPVTFTQIERTDENNVRIGVNVHFDAAGEETLQSFLVDREDPDLKSYSWRINESSQEIVELNLPVLPGEKEIAFYLKEPRILIQGPWVIPLK
ncbi:hypothetical protein [Paenibacillus contaminans]|uniref:DUF4179 domain-containing protein n=1 Tax=Paenibacillus contaminans TaxID=450362 RepID=A0A329MTF8_9BACL|nr:hypothetical protein [Paenibacillus contaminans]RAV21237.1 hypothetical protein DQG23_11280 [Paenibacillus contaminans]